MKHIKTFEELDFSQSSWMTTSDFLNMYYHCDNCDSLFKTFNKEIEKCPKCNCPKPDILSEDDYYKMIKPRLTEDDLKSSEEERAEDRETIIDYRLLADKEKNKRFYN